jgi:serine/threonine-protein kinase
VSSPDRWDEIEAALEAALEVSPENRSALLDRLCAADGELRREVDSLLAAGSPDDDFLELTVDAFAAPYLDHVAKAPIETDSPGDTVGRYRLIESIGRGGMGTVWLAGRSDGQFEQKVALKLVKRGMDTDEILDRFLRERQILARLEHPGIARLLDGGVSADDRPYFVMEYVAGEPITEHCDRRRLPIEARLRLFIDACQAVQYAHRNLVVHRDLKPANVLVTEDGEVKLLDFGIAKLVSDDRGATRMQSGGALMTPEYASPEQVAGEPVTTASDVYQLGVLLYELLSGHRPHSTAGRSNPDVARSVLESIPPRPSTAIRRVTSIVHRNGIDERIDPGVVTQRRGTSIGRLRRRLRGDLDTIAMKALRKEPDRRYPTAEDLGRDVERHLSFLPIRFGTDDLTYRTGKFLRRHRIGVAMASVGVLLLAGGASLYTVQVRGERDRARLEAAKATETAQIMGRFFQGWNPDAADRGQVSAGDMVTEAARRAELELRDQPETLAATLSVLGDLQTSLAEWHAADSLLRRALGIQERLHDGPDADLAATLARRGRLLDFMGEYDDAEASYRLALDQYRSLLGPRNAETLRNQRALASLLGKMNKLQEAEAMLRDVMRNIPEPDRATSPFALEASSDLGYVLFLQARFDEAVAILRPTLAQQRRLFGETYGPSLGTQRALGSALRDRGDLDEAEDLYRDVVRRTSILYGDERLEMLYARMVLSIVLDRKGELEEAESLARQTQALAEKIYGADQYGAATAGLAGILLNRGNRAESERLLRRGLAITRRSFPAGHLDEGDYLNRLAYILVARGAADADAFYREAVAFDRARPPGSPIFVSDGLHFLAWAEHRKGDLASAEASYRRALGLCRAQLANGHPDRAAAATGLGAVLLDLGRPAEAARYLREGLAQWQAREPAEPERVAEAEALLERALGPTAP